ncbi:MAG: DNA polymerase III subunit delta' [Thalassobaculales bacterium]
MHPRETVVLHGHAEAEAALLAALLADRLPSAYLIGGPRGIGKATLAYRFARALLAGVTPRGGGLFGDEPPSLAVDPQHPAARQIAAGAHRDLLVIQRTVNQKTGKMRGEIVVEDLAPLQGFLRQTAAHDGGWRVVIVDPADDLNPTTANRLLKLLEEPPPRCLWLLVAHSPGGLLPTIRSRCRRLTLAPLSAADCAAVLDRHLPADADRALLTELAGGSPGQAIALAQAGAAALHADILGLLAGLPRLDPQRLHGFADRLAAARAEPQFEAAMALLTDMLSRLLRNAPAPASELALRRHLLGIHGLDRWLTLWDNARRLVARAEALNLDRRQVVLDVFLGLAPDARP